MFTAPDFAKKQIIFVFSNEGEKISFSNDNIVIKSFDGRIKFQSTCYRLFIVYIVGNANISSVLIQKSKKFGFYIALMTAGYKLYSMIGAAKEGNTLLRKKQYSYSDIGIAKVIITNKVINQRQELKNIRGKGSDVKNAINILSEYILKIQETTDINELLAYEGLSAKTYFRSYFDNVIWQGRQPRIKKDFINATMDIGYTLLFSFVEALLLSYGFDIYCGVLHKEFYMRKSLVCDIVEPFRVLIDHEIKKGINLGQIKESDFTVSQGRYILKWSENSKYVSLFMKPLLSNKEGIFSYIQSYYRAFMKELPSSHFPLFELEGSFNDNC